jgi:hypothetical protein
MSTWNDFSEKEKLEWLRARLAQVESSLGALTRHVQEIADAVKEMEKKQRGIK